MSSSYLTHLYDTYRRTVEASKGILTAAEAEKRSLTADEEAAWQKANGDIDAQKRHIDEYIEMEKRLADAGDLEKRVHDALNTPPEVPAADGLTEDEKRVRAFLGGETRSLTLSPEKRTSFKELRTLSKLSSTAGANVVPTSFYDQLQMHLIEVSGILAAGATVLQTSSGEKIQIPKTTAHSTAALVAEAGTIGASDPTFGQLDLDAYKYALLMQVSTELLTDTAVDLLGYLAMQAGRAAGNAFGAHAMTGTGSSQPNGIVTASTLGVTGGTGVVGVFTADNLIDLFYSVIAPYRNSSACAWLMKDATLGNARKLKDTTNQYIWQPSFQVGAPETILGKPVHTDPNVAATSVSAKSVLFGDISQYFVRQVADIRFERSDDYAFNSDLVTFRCLVRMDGDLVDTTGAVKHFIGAGT